MAAVKNEQMLISQKPLDQCQHSIAQCGEDACSASKAAHAKKGVILGNG